MTTATIDNELSADPYSGERLEALMTTEPDFIDNPEFRKRGAARRILECGPDGSLPDDPPPRMPRRPKDLPAYVASLYEVPLLSRDQEPRAFRRMNFAKYRANVLRSRLDPENVDRELVDEIVELLEIAEESRNAIVRANLRLVVSIARRFASPVRPFDDLVSDGNIVLMQAVLKFDYGRGFRFSTYATHAIQRSLYRSVSKSHRDGTRFANGFDELIDETPGEDFDADLDDDARQHTIRLLLEHIEDDLADRERAIVLARFGLEAGEEPQTLKQLSERFGVCKERVRQIQIKALDKLRDLVPAQVESPTDTIGSATEATAETRR